MSKLSKGKVNLKTLMMFGFLLISLGWVNTAARADDGTLLCKIHSKGVATITFQTMDPNNLQLTIEKNMRNALKKAANQSALQLPLIQFRQMNCHVRQCVREHGQLTLQRRWSRGRIIQIVRFCSTPYRAPTIHLIKLSLSKCLGKSPMGHIQESLSMPR